MADMTPDPLPVALPELPLDRAVDWHLDGKPITYRDCIRNQCGELALSYAEAIQAAALRAQAEEVERLRALLLDARLFAASCPADMVRGSLNGMRVQLLHAIDAHLKDKP